MSVDYHLDKAVDTVLSRALDGDPPTRDEAIALAGVSGPEFGALLSTASLLRDRGWGRTVTYSRKVFIPLTNLCRDHCRYCTFAVSPTSPAARMLIPDEVLTIARAGVAAGCKEALFSLGEKPEEVYERSRRELRALGYETTTQYLAAMCRLVFEETGLMPHANCGVLEPEELEALRPWNVSMGLMLENISDRLLGPGLAHTGSPGKVPALRIKTIEDAGRLGIPFTDRHPDWYRRNARRTGPIRCSRSATCSSDRGTCKRSSSRTSAPRTTRRCAARTSRRRWRWPVRSRLPA